jgi:hypothetical protein
LILALIDLLALSPVAGTDDPNHVAAKREANCQDAFVDAAETKVPRFIAAVSDVDCDDATWIREGVLCSCEADAMLAMILAFLRGVPLESRAHATILPRIHI